LRVIARFGDVRDLNARAQADHTHVVEDHEAATATADGIIAIIVTKPDVAAGVGGGQFRRVKAHSFDDVGPRMEILRRLECDLSGAAATASKLNPARKIWYALDQRHDHHLIAASLWCQAFHI